MENYRLKRAKSGLAWLLTPLAALLLAGSAGAADTVLFGGMRLTYSGKGYVVASPYSNGGSWNVWDLAVVDETYEASLATLSIRPAEKDPTNFCVRIRSLKAPALKSLKILFPPGGNGTGYIRDIHIGAGVKSIVIAGGDLGSNEGGDGLLGIKGGLELLSVSGQKWKDKASGQVSYWGGNVWADAEIAGTLEAVKITGGHFGYLPGADWQRQPRFHVTRNIGSFQLRSFNLKDSSGALRQYGGFAGADLVCGGTLGSFQVLGGAWHNGHVTAPCIRKCALTGPKAGAALPMPPAAYGLHNAALTACGAGTTSPAYFTNYYLGACQFKGASVAGSLIAAHGQLKGLNIAGDKAGNGGSLSDSRILSGAGYDAAWASAPVISALCTSSKVFPAGTNQPLAIEFTVSNLPPEEVSAIYISNRDLAWDAAISNSLGQTYSGYRPWLVSGTNQVTGFLVWNPDLASFDFGGADHVMVTNLSLGVLYGSAPRHRTDLKLSLKVRPKYQEPASQTNLVSSAAAKAPERAAYPGSIARLSCLTATGNAIEAGIREARDGLPEHATYLGSVNALKTTAAAGNRILSKKEVKVPKDFDYEANELWIGGQRQAAPLK